MKAIFRAVFYLRSNYVNKEGKTPVMLRIYLNNDRLDGHCCPTVPMGQGEGTVEGKDN